MCAATFDECFITFEELGELNSTQIRDKAQALLDTVSLQTVFIGQDSAQEATMLRVDLAPLRRSALFEFQWPIWTSVSDFPYTAISLVSNFHELCVSPVRVKVGFCSQVANSLLSVGRTGVYALDMNSCKLTDLSSLSGYSALRELDISFNHFSNEAFALFCATCPLGLRKLTMKGCKLDTSSAIALSTAIKLRMPQLHSLDISFNKLDERSISRIGISLLRSSSLHSINVSNNNISSFVGLMRSLSTCSKLKSINLGYQSGLTSSPWLSFPVDHYDTFFPDLEHFDVSGLCLNDSALHSISTILGRTDCCLTSLRIRRLRHGKSNITVAGAIVLLNALSSNHTVTEFDFSGMKLGDGICSAVGQLLSSNSTITALSIDGMDIGSYGVSRISSGLRKNSTLESLNLRENLFLADSSQLWEALSSNQSISELNVSTSDYMLTISSASALERMLRNNRKIKSLKMLGAQLYNPNLLDKALISNTTLLLIHGIPLPTHCDITRRNKETSTRNAFLGFLTQNQFNSSFTFERETLKLVLGFAGKPQHPTVPV